MASSTSAGGLDGIVSTVVETALAGSTAVVGCSRAAGAAGATWSMGVTADDGAMGFMTVRFLLELRGAKPIPVLGRRRASVGWAGFLLEKSSLRSFIERAARELEAASSNVLQAPFGRRAAAAHLGGERSRFGERAGERVARLQPQRLAGERAPRSRAGRGRAPPGRVRRARAGPRRLLADRHPLLGGRLEEALAQVHARPAARAARARAASLGRSSPTTSSSNAVELMDAQERLEHRRRAARSPGWGAREWGRLAARRGRPSRRTAPARRRAAPAARARTQRRVGTVEVAAGEAAEELGAAGRGGERVARPASAAASAAASA